MVLKDFQKRIATQIEDVKLPVLDKYLSQKYAYVKTRSLKEALQKQILSEQIHKRTA